MVITTKLLQCSYNYTNYYRCGFVKVYPNSDIGIVIDLNNYYPCIVPHHNQKCRIVLMALIAYCRSNKSKLKINHLQLTDNSMFHCPISKTGIRLLLSNQLLCKLSYYINFGFSPIHHSAFEKIKRNLIKMRLLTTSEFNLIEFFKKHHIEITDDIIKLIQNENLIKNVLKYISKLNCDLYASFYSELYVEIGLEKLKSDEEEFIIEL